MPRIKLTITEVKPKRSGTGQKGGPFEALDFLATVTNGTTALKFSIFNKKELFPFITVGAPIDADVIDKPSGNYDANGIEFINHNVVNIYVNDEPVIKPQGKQGWQPRQDSPEQRRSIERQVAAKLAFEYAPDNASTRESLVLAEAIYQWISEGKFPPETGGKAKTTDKTVKTPQQADTTPEETGLGGKPEDSTILEFKNPGEFYTACLKHFKLSKSIVDKEISMFDLANAKQRKDAWQTIVATYIKKEA